MKKLLLSMLVLMTAATASAQWAVADAPNLAQNVKNFSELQKQVGYLKEQKDRLDETLDMMRKVNSVISSCETAKSIIERQGRLSEKCIDLVTNKKLGTSTLQTHTTRPISRTRPILSTSVKMNDSERLAVLQEIERQTIEQERKVSKVSRIISQYERLKRNLR